MPNGSKNKMNCIYSNWQETIIINNPNSDIVMQMLNYGTYYNLNYLSEIADGDVSFMSEMTHTFVNQTPKMITELKSAVANSDYELSCYLSHKLKSSCEILGMSYAATICLKIETAAINKQSLTALIDDLEVLVHQLTVSTQELNMAAA
jgi:HPt (histidine-containing phosphotransfer) domain-containing protein